MSRLGAYVADGVLRLFALVLLAGVATFAAIDAGEDVDDFARAGLAAHRAAACVAARLPGMAVLILPMAAAIAVTVQLGLLARRHELVAMRAAGVGDHQAFAAIAGVGFALAVLHFALAEYVAPAANRRASAIWEREVRKRPDPEPVWIALPGLTCLAREANPSFTALRDAVFLFPGSRTERSRHLEADEAVFTGNGRWRLLGCRETAWAGDGERRTATHERRDVAARLWPADFAARHRRPNEFTLRELAAAARRDRARGDDGRAWRVDWHARLATVAGTLVLALAAAAVGLRRDLREPLGTVALGVFWTFAYWVLSNTFLALGYDRLLPPMAAAWFPNGLMAVASLALGLGSAQAAAFVAPRRR
jgi:lipopolysaccharide export system permease protein